MLTSTPNDSVAAMATTEAFWSGFQHLSHCTNLGLWFLSRPALPPSSTIDEIFSQVQQGRQAERDLAAAGCGALGDQYIGKWASDVTLAILSKWGAPVDLKILLLGPLVDGVKATDAPRQQADVDTIDATVRAWNTTHYDGLLDWAFFCQYFGC